MKRAYLFVGLMLFVALEAGLFLDVDRPVALWAHALDRTHPELINLFRSYTDVGKSKWSLWPSGLATIFCLLLVRVRSLAPLWRARAAVWGKSLLFVFACVALSGLVTDAIKPILGRARPVEFLRDGLYGFFPGSFTAAFNSMPSGHTTTAFALMGALYVVWPRARIFWLAGALALGISRMMVDAHFVSDTLAGALVGSLTVWVLRPLFYHQWKYPIIMRLFPIDAGDGKV